MTSKHIAPAALMVLAGPALAHSGPHAHPHGSEPWIVAMGVALIGAAALIAWRRK